MKSQKQQHPNKLLQKWEVENMQKVMARKLSGVKSTIPSIQGREQGGRTTSHRPPNCHTSTTQENNPKQPGQRPSSTPYSAIRSNPPMCRSECSRRTTAAQHIKPPPQSHRKKLSQHGVDRAISDCMHSILKVARAVSAANTSQASRNAPRTPHTTPMRGRVATANAARIKLDPPPSVRSSVRELKDLLRAKLLMVSEEVLPDTVGEGQRDKLNDLKGGLGDTCCTSSDDSANGTPAASSNDGPLQLPTIDSTVEQSHPPGGVLSENPAGASPDRQIVSACQLEGLACVLKACKEEPGGAGATAEGVSSFTAVGYNDSDDGSYKDDAFEEYEDDFEDSSTELKRVDAEVDCEKEYKDAVVDICNSLQELDMDEVTQQPSRHTLASVSASRMFSAEFALSMEDLVLTKSFLLGTLGDNQAFPANFRVSYAGETVGEGGYEEDGTEHDYGYKRDPQYCSETQADRNDETERLMLTNSECSFAHDSSLT